jgi:hypothetical protein
MLFVRVHARKKLCGEVGTLIEREGQRITQAHA